MKAITKLLFVTSALTALAACSSSGSSGGSPDPILTAGGTPAAPRNTVLNELSFEHPSEPQGVDETFDLAVTALSVTGDASGAEIFNGVHSAFFGSGQTLDYDADNNTFTFDISLTGLQFEGNAIDDITVNEVFGPVLLTNPVDDGRFDNGVTAILVAAQTDRFGLDETLIQANASIADQFISSLAFGENDISGAANIAAFGGIATNFGSITTGPQDPGDPSSPTVITDVTAGFLEELIAFNPALFGLGGTVQAGNVQSASDFLDSLVGQDPSAFTNLQAIAAALNVTGTGGTDFGLLPGLLAAYPNSFGVNTVLTGDSAGAQFFLEVLNSIGGSTPAAVIEFINEFAAEIQTEDFFVYTQNGVFFFQKKLSTNGSTTLQVGVNGLEVPNAQGGTDYIYTVFGERTLSDEMPVTGSATYSGSLIGSLLFQNRVEQLRGGVTAAIDFDTSLIDMTLEADIATIGLGGETIFLDYDTFTGSGDINDTTFSGNLQAQDEQSLVGTFDGAFFGVRGEEIGGTFEFSNSEVAATGGFVAVDEANDNTD